MKSTVKQCGNCGVDVTTERSGVINNRFFSVLCHNCVANPTTLASKEYDRDRQRENHAADVAQPWAAGKPNRKFIDAYPDRVNEYFTSDDLKEMQ